MTSKLAAASPSKRLPGKRRGFSWPLFRYVLREFLGILGITLLAFATLFLVAALYDDLEDFTSRKIPAVTIARYFLLLQPDMLLTVIPMSLLLAAMYTVATMCKNNELTAIRASGLSILHAFQPLLLVAFCFMLLQGFLAEFVAPASRNRALGMHERLTSRPSEVAAARMSKTLAYRNRQDRRDWVFRNFQPKGISSDVVVTQFRPEGTVAWELRAREAHFDETAGHWRFSDVLETVFTEVGTELAEPPRQAATLAREELREKPDSMSFYFSIKPAIDMSISDIVRVLNHPDGDLSAASRAVLRTHLYSRISLPFSCMIAVLLGIPLAIFRERSATMRSIILGVVVMALYYVLAQLFVMMGKTQTLPPLLAGTFPTLLFLSWGMWEMKRKI